MAIRFNLYYFSQTIGEYLQKVINSTSQGVVARAFLLSTTLPESLENGADVCLIEYDDQVPGFDKWIENIQHHTEHMAIFLYLREANTDTLLKALRLGVQECFVTQVSEDDLQRAIQRLLKAKTASNPGEKSQIISLLGCKGGAGGTFIAVNLTQSLAAIRQQSVLLLDLDLRAGNISSFLDIQPRYTILDVIENFDRIDPQYLKDIILTTESGIDVLPGPPRLEDSELVQPHHLEKILQYIRSQNLYRWILLDLGDVLDEITLKCLELSDLVLLITLLTIPGLRNAKKVLELFQLLEFPEDKIQLVANCFCKESDIQLGEAIKFLGQEFLSSIRFDHNAVVRSINDGKPLVKTQPRHRLSLDFSGLAKYLSPNGEDNQYRSWGLANLKRMLHLGA
jgi:pilus assembly protein CpaE